jgi:hypothetical protein
LCWCQKVKRGWSTTLPMLGVAVREKEPSLRFEGLEVVRVRARWLLQWH